MSTFNESEFNTKEFGAYSTLAPDDSGITTIDEKYIWNGQESSIVITYATIIEENDGNKYFQASPTIWHGPSIRLTDDRWRMEFDDFNYISLKVRMKNSANKAGFKMSFYSWFHGHSKTIDIKNYVNNINDLYTNAWNEILIPIDDFKIGSTFVFTNVEMIYFSKQNSTEGPFTVEIDDIKAIKQTITIPEIVPVLSFDSNFISGNIPLTVLFNNTSIENELTLNWIWDFGDGNTSIEKNPTHIYNNIGTYSVKLIATTNDNRTFEIIKEDYIFVYDNENLIVEFEPHITTGENPTVIRFEDRTIAGDLEIVEWFWDFGDYSYSTEQNPIHIYMYPGSYDITLQIKTNTGKIINETKRNFINLEDSGYRPPNPTAEKFRFGVNFDEIEFYMLDEMSYIKIPIELENWGTRQLDHISVTKTQKYIDTLNDFSLYPGEKKTAHVIYVRNNLIDQIENAEKSNVEIYVDKVITVLYQKFRSFISLDNLIEMIKSIWK